MPNGKLKIYIHFIQYIYSRSLSAALDIYAEKCDEIESWRTERQSLERNIDVHMAA